ncbi:hypothetical protein COCNU_02G002660 [Cocos nucifera]|uniref:Uncharacterized protein n=1 Tax=Cocos nucifera TaxID=13894 RepID=A0A8K0HYN0_COCNU|nr:hypothetical protein COCNU_02G002660 [Cocos nucifera]
MLQLRKENNDVPSPFPMPYQALNELKRQGKTPEKPEQQRRGPGKSPQIHSPWQVLDLEPCRPLGHQRWPKQEAEAAEVLSRRD